MNLLRKTYIKAAPFNLNKLSSSINSISKFFISILLVISLICISRPNFAVSPIALAAEPDNGPFGPIIMYSTDQASTWSRYLREMLDADGISSVRVQDISQLTTGLDFSAYDTIVIGPGTGLSDTQVQTLTEQASAGRTVILIRPPATASGLAGITPQGTTIASGTWTGSGDVETRAFANLRNRFITEADVVVANDGTAVIATINEAGTPAVTRKAVDAGQVYAVMWDLAASTERLRQGDPGNAPNAVRPADLLIGIADPNQLDAPHADLAVYLLGNLIEEGQRARRPLPRTWYLPFQQPIAFVMTGDDHNAYNDGGGTTGRFNNILIESAVAPMDGGADDWLGFRHTSYLFPNVEVPGAADFIAKGFELSTHPSIAFNFTTDPRLFGECQPPDSSSYPNLNNLYTNWNNDLFNRFSSAGLPAPITVRNHCIAWDRTYTGIAEAEANNGYRADLNYYHYPRERWGAVPGSYITGAALPMRFARADGSIINIDQFHTHLTDETQTPDEVRAGADAFIANARNRSWYGAITILDHTDLQAGSEAQAVIDAVKADLSAVGSRRLPIVSAAQLVDWLSLRRGSVWSEISWQLDGVMTMRLDRGSDSRLISASGLSTMLPATLPDGRRLVAVSAPNGQSLTLTSQLVHGIEHILFVTSVSGIYTAVYQ